MRPEPAAPEPEAKPSGSPNKIIVIVVLMLVLVIAAVLVRFNIVRRDTLKLPNNTSDCTDDAAGAGLAKGIRC